MATWVERHRDQIEILRTYVAGFRGHVPDIFSRLGKGAGSDFEFGPDSERGTAILLCFAALYQGIAAAKLMELLAALWRGYGSDFLRLNRLPFDGLKARINGHPGLENWEIRKQAPGILRSVCDFFYRHGSPLSWARSVGDAEECIGILCEEIFLMGKTSIFKSKPRYFLWLLTQVPESHPETFWTARSLLPITPGHLRFMREFGPLQGRESVPWRKPEEKLAYVNRFLRLLAPDSPWSAYAPLDAYLKPAFPADKPHRWECSRILEGCMECPLAPSCPGREET